MTPQPIVLSDAYYTVPSGKLVNAVTWLEMRVRPSPSTDAALDLRQVRDGDFEIYQALFAAIGTPWLWSRAFSSAFDGTVAVSPLAYVAHDDERRIGVVEFDGLQAGEIEVSWFGLLPDAIGRGLGRRMMDAALEIAWSHDPQRVWLHTCNFDHPGAVRFYQSCGFVPYATGFEIMDDPRLAGELPRNAAPHVPLIENGDGRSSPPNER